MSMIGANMGAVEVGETVGSFSSYEGAQKAVASLIEADITPRDIAIVGRGLRSVERITSKLGYAQAARAGAVNGVMLGLAVCAVQAIFNPETPGVLFVASLLICLGLGMMLSFVSFMLVRRRRSYASIMAAVADEFDVTVAATSLHRAREVMGQANPARARKARVIDTSPPAYGERLPEYEQSAENAAPADPAARVAQNAEPGVPRDTPNASDAS